MPIDPENERWTHHIDFTITDGDFKVELAEFKNYIQYAHPLDSYDAVHNQKSLVQRFKAWLWNKGFMTLPVRRKE